MFCNLECGLYWLIIHVLLKNRCIVKLLSKVFFFFFHHFDYIMPLPLVFKVSAEKLADRLMGVPLFVTSWFSLAAFRFLSLSLIFAILVVMCLGVALFGFVLFWTLCVSWTWMSVSSLRLRMFSAIISYNKFYAAFSLLLLGPL